MNQEELEAAVREALKKAPRNAASEGSIHGLIQSQREDVDRAFLNRTLEQMHALGQLELVGDKKGMRRYALSESGGNGGGPDE